MSTIFFAFETPASDDPTAACRRLGLDRLVADDAKQTAPTNSIRFEFFQLTMQARIRRLDVLPQTDARHAKFAFAYTYGSRYGWRNQVCSFPVERT